MGRGGGKDPKTDAREGDPGSFQGADHEACSGLFPSKLGS